MFWVFLSLLPLIPTWLLFLSNRQILIAKLTNIKSLLNKDAIYRAYARSFGRNAALDMHGRNEEIEGIFREHYSLRMYGAPLILGTVITWTFSGSWVVGVANDLSAHIGVNPSDLDFLRFLKAIPETCQAGFWGAYTWGLYDLIVRYRSRDFTPAFAHSMWIRLLTSSLLAGFLGTTGRFGQNPLVDFGIGSLPTVEIVRWIQSFSRRHLGVRQQTELAESPTLHYLQGATRTIINRLGEEGIESAHHLAYADPFLLYLRTNLPWVTIIDLMDQAVLFNYLTVKISKIYPAGIRGAIEFARISEDIRPGRQAGPETADLLNQLAKLLGIDKSPLLNLIQTCEEDYQVELLGSLFGEAFGDG